MPHWAYPNGSVGLNVTLEHMIRVYDNEFLAQFASISKGKW